MAAEPIRILVHAGFHKTGTSSLQDFLLTNRAALRPWFRYYGKADFRAAGTWARRYGQRPWAGRLWVFRQALRRFLRDLPDGENVVLSRETFCGVMPGHRRALGQPVRSYWRAALPLARAIASELRRRFGDAAEIVFLYTTRARDPWLASVHGHLLRSIRLTDDLAGFRARLRDTPPLEDEAGRLRDALPGVRVETAALEDYAMRPAGPAEAVLDLMGVPAAARDALTPVGRSNPGQPDTVRAEFLALNRAGGRKTRLKSRKQSLLRKKARTDHG